MAAEAGKPNKKPRDKKNIRNLKMREKLMFDLKQGTTSLLSFQQAIGGSLSRSARVTQDMDEDDEALECSSGSVVITVPALNEIVVPAELIPPAATSQPTSHPPSLPPSLPPCSAIRLPVRDMICSKQPTNLLGTLKPQ